MDEILQRYNVMFSELLTKLARFNKVFDSELEPVIKEACELLRVAKLVMSTYQSEEDENKDNGKKIELYANGSHDEARVIHKRFVAQSGVVMVFDAFAQKGADEYTSLEIDKINVLMMILFTFGEKSKSVSEPALINDKAKEIEAMFPKAIEDEEFLVYYQPKVVLKNYELSGAEALCRWIHEGKMVFPGDFIPVLESSTLICELDFYMLEHVCKDIRTWIDEGKNVVRVSVNLSRKNISTPNLLDKIVGIIDKYDVPHELIEIELVETAGELNDEDLDELVNGLRTNGISTAVDDFGTGFSSLSLIRNLPWNVIKIDRSLLPEDPNKNTEQFTMLRHLLTMLYDMGFKCIVEGVETVEQVKILKENNCYVAQGFYFDRPLPRDEFIKRLDASR